MVTDSRWKMEDVSRLSPEMSPILLPSSSKNWYADSFVGPSISTAIGRNVCAVVISVYFSHFLAAAS